MQFILRKTHMTKHVSLFIAILVGVLFVGGAAAFMVFQRDVERERAEDTTNTQRSSTRSTNSRTNSTANVSQETDDEVQWEFSGTEWRAFGTPPSCPDPLVFDSPVDVSRVTSILYPGQERGGNYKPHGGFRFDTIEDNMMEVSAPMDSVVVNGARYLVDGEVQYTFDFIAPCGVMFRLGHLFTLSPKFMAIAETFPAARENDSRTTEVNPPVSVKAGESIATAIGVKKDTNTFVDFGVYDLREKNEASRDAAWTALHADDRILAPYAICWFENLPAGDAVRIKSLPPADPTSGRTSDYCD